MDEKENVAVEVREATPEDAAAVAEIYAYYVEHTAVSFELEPPDEAEMRRRMEAHGEEYPFLVAELGGETVGFAYAAPLKDRAAYRPSAEVTVYVKKGCRRRGVGRALYEELEYLLRVNAFTNVFACIAYPSGGEDRYLDKTSPYFHRAMGYKVCGVFENCAVKFDTWYSMIWMGKSL